MIIVRYGEGSRQYPTCSLFGDFQLKYWVNWKLTFKFWPQTRTKISNDLFGCRKLDLESSIRNLVDRIPVFGWRWNSNMESGHNSKAGLRVCSPSLKTFWGSPLGKAQKQPPRTVSSETKQTGREIVDASVRPGSSRWWHIWWGLLSLSVVGMTSGVCQGQRLLACSWRGSFFLFIPRERCHKNSC
jgi:hypothetical protein